MNCFVIYDRSQEKYFRGENLPWRWSRLRSDALLFRSVADAFIYMFESDPDRLVIPNLEIHEVPGL